MKKLFIETYGCQMNVADSEVVASVMQMADYETCDDISQADAIFLNTCSVRDNAEQKIYNRLDTLNAERKKGRHVILGVLGCMAERVKNDLIDSHHADLVAGPDSYLSLPELIAAAETGNKAINIELSTTETYRDIVPQRLHANRVGGFVSIMRGCNNFCHYCIVPYTRGRERSRDVESILREVRDLRDRGFKEVTLLGQNVNSYKAPSNSPHGGEQESPAMGTGVGEAVNTPSNSPHGGEQESLAMGEGVGEAVDICKHWGAFKTAHPFSYGALKQYAFENRKFSTQAEVVLWDILRNKGFGYKFRRQHIIGDFIVDFICLSERLVIELDGGYHLTAEQAQEDKLRTQFLNECGFNVIRFTNDEVLVDTENVVNRIKANLKASPTGGGREGASFPYLLRLVAEAVPEMRVRFTTSHPKDMSDETLRVIAEVPNVCKHIHLPVQSGSNRILKLMNRKYTREWYLDRVAAIRSIVPDCGLSTDIFVGYHSETEEDHQQSLSLMREVGYDSAFMFKYSERPGTYASKHLPDDVPEEVKIRRLNELIHLQTELSAQANRRDEGKAFDILIEGYSKRSRNQLFGRTEQNKVVIIDKGNHHIGETVHVKITGSTSATLFGEEIIK